MCFVEEGRDILEHHFRFPVSHNMFVYLFHSYLDFAFFMFMRLRPAMGHCPFFVVFLCIRAGGIASCRECEVGCDKFQYGGLCT